MSSNDTEKSATGYYPINFIAPLSLEECANRIRQSYNQRMGVRNAMMQGHLEKTDDITYTFSLYQDLRFGRETVSGRLKGQSESSTVIDAQLTNSNPLGGAGGSSFILILLLASLCGFASSRVSAALGLITLGLLFGILLFARWKRKSAPPSAPKPPISELLWYFERTLKN